MAIWSATMEDMVINHPTFWQNKKVIITGHTGFKGGWMSTWLKLLGAQVSGYALPPKTNPHFFAAAKVEEGMTSIYGDILDEVHLTKVFKDLQPEIVFHFAAQPLVQYSYLHPAETYKVNVIGTVNVLEAVRMVDSVKVVIVVTSDKCYENREWVWGYRESDAMGGHDPYSSSKGCAELVVSAYRRSFFNSQQPNSHAAALATVRAGNVIGGGDWAENRLIPDLLRSFMKNETARLRYPHAHRPWQYILDPLQGYLALAEHMWHHPKRYADAWNFGPSEENVKSVEWVANQFASFWTERAKWDVDGEMKPHEAKCLKLDSNKSRTALQWTPKFQLSDVLKNTCDWYQAYYHHENMAAYSLQQIKEYMSKG